jgi:hypothetical protein
MKNSTIYMLAGIILLAGVIIGGVLVPLISVLWCGFSTTIGGLFICLGIISTLEGN